MTSDEISTVPIEVHPAQDLDQLRREFAALHGRVSHDLQATMRNIASFSSYVWETARDRLTEREAGYLARIERGAQRGASVVRDLGTLTTLSSTELHLGSVDLAAVAHKAAADLQGSLDGRDVQLELPPAGGPRIEADLALSRMAVWHLLANAVKFTRPVGRARIQVLISWENDRCVFAVQDNGVGFSPDYAHKLFSPFERLHYDHEFEGNGIGLAVVREVAARHGGTVGAGCDPARGTRFWIAFPVQRAGGTTAESAPRERGAAPGAAPGGCILAIDDEPLVRMTVRSMLERDGYEVVTATGGEEGLRMLASMAATGRRVDVVICDWLMPDSGGTTIAHSARRLHPDARVILLTGMRLDAGDEASSRAFDLVLSKPARGVDLRRAVRDMMPGHRDE